jgi:hypothetical protein
MESESSADEWATKLSAEEVAVEATKITSLLEQNKRVLSIIEKVILRRGRMQTGEDPLGARSTAGAGV